jgi:aldehyde dehydrogenase (NAD+)
LRRANKGVNVTATAEHTDLDRTRFFIDGEWVEPRGGQTHEALEAATGEHLGTGRTGH